MAISSGFKFTNTTATTSKVMSLYDLDETKYTEPEVTNSEARYSNMSDGTSFTSELVRVRTNESGPVKTLLTVDHPSKTAKSASYSVQVEDLLVTTDSADPQFEVDDPIIVKISVVHPKSNYITASHVQTVINRAASLLQSTSGAWKIANLMQGGKVLGDF